MAWKPISTFPDGCKDVVLVVEWWSDKESCTAKRTSTGEWVAFADGSVALDHSERNSWLEMFPIAWMEIPKAPVRATRMKDGHTILWYEQGNDTLSYVMFNPSGEPTALTGNGLTRSDAYDIELRLIEVHGGEIV